MRQRKRHFCRRFATSGRGWYCLMRMYDTPKWGKK